MEKKIFTFAATLLLTICLACPAAFAAKDKPNILVIMPDDVGWSNPSVYNMGMMGYQDAEHRSYCQ